MYEIASHLTLAHITNVIIARRHKCLIIDGEEEGRYGYGVGVAHRGIPHGGACPPTGGAHDGGSIPGPKMRDECWNSGFDGRMEAAVASIHLEVVVASIHLEAAVAATSKSVRLWETLSTASQVLNLYQNPIK
jgi:hypothetical protein